MRGSLCTNTHSTVQWHSLWINRQKKSGLPVLRNPRTLLPIHTVCNDSLSISGVSNKWQSVRRLDLPDLTLSEGQVAGNLILHHSYFCVQIPPHLSPNGDTKVGKAMYYPTVEKNGNIWIQSDAELVRCRFDGSNSIRACAGSIAEGPSKPAVQETGR